MRDLTKKQKDLIRKWVNDSKHKQVFETFYTYKVSNVDDLTYEQWELLEEMNDSEVLYQNVNNFIKDLNQV